MTGSRWLSARVAGLLLGVLVGRDVGQPVEAVRQMPAATSLAAALGAPPVSDRARAAAVAAIATRCLRSGGVDVTVTPLPPVPIVDDQLDPVAWARRWGFGITTTPSPAGLPSSAGEGRWLAHPCHRLAERTVLGLRDRVLAPLSGPLRDLSAAVTADPRRLQAAQAWATCLEPVAPGAARETLWPQLHDRFRSALVDVGSPDDLAALQATERAVAVVVATCEQRYQDRIRVIRAAHERRFVRRHGTMLAGLGATIRRIEATYPSGP